MKLIYVNDALAIWGGLERVLADKINYLASVCHYEILLVTINQGNHLLPYSLHPSVSHQDLKINLHHKYHYRGLKRLWITIIFEWLYITRLRHVVRNYKPEAIVLMRFDHWEVYFCTQGIPLVVESHSMCISNMFGNRSFLQRIRINLSKYLTKRARVLVTLTEGDAKDWSRYTNKIEIIPSYKPTTKTETVEGIEITWNYQELAGYVVKIADVETASYTMTNEKPNKGDTVVGTDGTSGKIQNTPGSELPSTGGIGTTIFYVLGTTLFLAQASFL